MIDDSAGGKESAVIGVADAAFGEAVGAVIVPDGSAPTDIEVIAHCRTQLANFKVTKRVQVIDVLPRNAMGKVQKNLLRDQFDPVKAS